MSGAIHTRFAGVKSSYASKLQTAGDTVVITPSAGRRILVYWVFFMPNPDNASANFVTVKFTNGQIMYAGYLMSHWELFEGNVDDTVTVNLENAGPVAVNILYREVNP